MAAHTMTVVELDATLVDMAGHASVEAGNVSAGDPIYIPNDGKTILVVHGVTGDIFTFTAVACSHGRTEVKALTVAAGDIAIIGPFPPSLWNNGDGNVTIVPTAGNNGDFLLAVKLP